MVKKRSLRSKSYYGWQGYALYGQNFELGFAPDLGGRIISLQYHGEELFYVDHNRSGETFDFSKISDLREEKRRLGFRLWGGDKTWVAPEPAWIEAIPPLELDAGPYSSEINENKISMMSLIDRETGLQITRKVSLQPNDRIVLHQTFLNTTDQPICRAIWNVTQLLRPFEIYFIADPSDIFPDVRFSASKTHRERLITKEGVWSKITCEESLLFKYGSKVKKGLIVALKRGKNKTIGMVREFSIDLKADYPHDGIVEIYNSDQYPYLELEILSPLLTIHSKGSITHEQTWFLGHFHKNVLPDEVVEYFTG